MNSTTEQTRVPVSVLISGRGSNMMSLVRAAHDSNFPAKIVHVISNRPDARGLIWARAQGITTTVLDDTTFESCEAFECALHSLLVASGVELVALAGFMRIITPKFISYWKNRILNIHPSLLPSFKGLNVHTKTLEAGVKIAGCTVHYVTSELDSGPIIIQGAVSVLQQDTPDTLAARILEVEHEIYPLALRLVSSGSAFVVNGKVVFDNACRPDARLIHPKLKFL
ncbi:MAG: phosphoribosylglycinamide formyltransferase [Hyphomicrobiaceae bacterium]|nr:phosphoribosylglycinamide formyltransferase [Hyphomicrobiaceae bacterium]